VGFDGAVGEAEALSYLAIGEAVGGQLDDLEFLGRELIDGAGGPVVVGLA
jgi:hypothetical protein